MGVWVSEIEDLSGVKLGRLTVIELLKDTGRPKWLCLCDCGSEISVSHIALIRPRRGSDGSYQGQQSCGCVGKLYQGPAWVPAFRMLVGRYKAHAQVKDLEFSLSSDELDNLFRSACHYCGVPPNQVIAPKRKNKEYLDSLPEDHFYIHNGIDRIDSNRGYIVDNCVSSCFVCNRAKSNMEYSDFIVYLDRVAENRNSQVSD